MKTIIYAFFLINAVWGIPGGNSPKASTTDPQQQPRVSNSPQNNQGSLGDDDVGNEAGQCKNPCATMSQTCNQFLYGSVQKMTRCVDNIRRRCRTFELDDPNRKFQAYGDGKVLTSNGGTDVPIFMTVGQPLLVDTTGIDASLFLLLVKITRAREDAEDKDLDLDHVYIRNEPIIRVNLSNNQFSQDVAGRRSEFGTFFVLVYPLALKGQKARTLAERIEGAGTMEDKTRIIEEEIDSINNPIEQEQGSMATVVVVPRAVGNENTGNIPSR